MEQKLEIRNFLSSPPWPTPPWKEK
jgi:hypothetical protein